MEKLWCYGKNYGTMEKNYDTIPKTMNLYLLWKKVWYYGKNMVL